MPKSAEDDLFKGMYNLPKAERRRRIDAYAHELAEKQRAVLEAYPGILEPALISVIDPEVSCAPACACLCHEADPSPCDDCVGVLNSADGEAVRPS
jgi:hypothetical protein